ncbi:MAG TPA: thiol peroxidase [bacterium]|nr:thiol peroxidase [bacterium]HNW15219.1 thiol peroxidase [bacterium]HOG44777.1 thiol peroxidase [bacterium]HPV22166.1 thiol peroxidase [bacterium]HPY15947.1 thiol peroxidase [bacterium]
MVKRTGVITFGGNPLTLAGNEIKVGAKAPDFYALNSKLQPVKLSDFDGKVRIISVFPSIDTPVCAAQTRRFNVEAANLGDVQILTVSCDLPFALGRFCAAEGIDKEITLSDHKELDFGLKYGFAIDELRLLSRGVVVVDKDGVVKHVEYVKEITEEPDYDSAIEAVKKII